MKTVILTQVAQVDMNGITSTKDLSLNPTGSRIIFVHLKSVLNFTHSSKANLMASLFQVRDHSHANRKKGLPGLNPGCGTNTIWIRQKTSI